MSGAPLNADVRFWRDPALPGIEARSSTYTKHAFRTHTHAAWTVAVVGAGRTRFRLGSGQRLYEAQTGQMVVIPAGWAHACNPQPGSGFSYRLVALAPAWLTGLNGTAARPQNRLPRFASPVLDDPALCEAWGGLHQAFVLGAPAAQKRSLLRECLRGLLSRHATGGPPLAGAPPADAIAGTIADANANPAVALALRFIARHPGEFLPLDELARRAGISRHRFAHVFKAATGLPPHAYQMQQAIEHAKSLLAEGVSISRTALEAGFADQSHFSRRFRQFTGATPRQYAEAGTAKPVDSNRPAR